MWLVSDLDDLFVYFYLFIYIILGNVGDWIEDLVHTEQGFYC